METEVNKIEFYKVRTLGERFSATGDFIRENWKLLLKNIGLIGAPLAIIVSYLSQGYAESLSRNLLSNDFSSISPIYMIVFILLNIVFQLFIYSMTGAILYQASTGELSENTGWKDLKGDMFSIMGKGLVQGFIILILWIGILLITFLLGYVFGISHTIFSGKLTFFLFFLMIVFLVLLPPFAMITYPIFFEEESASGALLRGLKLGFKNWGAVFLTILLGGLLLMAFSYLFNAPYLIYNLAFPQGGILGYILAAISSLGTVIISPVFLIFMGFQYTSIVEKEEGTSLQEEMDDFEQL